jgi:hypothetical protein
MNNRLKDVYSYKLFDTPPNKELDEITELASIIFDTPISLITVLDDKRQWFKSNKGLDVNETRIEDSFCRHTLHKPDEVLVVNDALEDQRFVNNKLVMEKPNIRFYAGAPLVTKKNNVLGTLCVIDRKPRELSDEKKRALQILAKKVMKIIETKTVLKRLNMSINFSTERLIKITQNLPIGIFELNISKSMEVNFSFLNEGMKNLHPNINIADWIKDPMAGYSLIHPDDLEDFKDAMEYAIKNMKTLYHEYRVKSDSGYLWHAINGQPYKTDEGGVIIYGSFVDVTNHVEYEAALEQIAFDISHVLRHPITSMLGITNVIELENKLSSEKVKEYSNHLQTITKELEKYTRKLNGIYLDKKTRVNNYNKRNRN